MAKINDWLSIDKNSGTGNSYVTLTASSYEGLQDRATSLKVKTEGKEVILNIRQTAFVNHFALNKNLISPVWEGGEYSNYVVSNIGWSYTSSEWLSLSVTSGSVGRTEFNVVVQPNTSEEVRIGYVNIVSNNGATLGTIKVAQASHNQVNNIIFYTSTDGKKITPYSSTGVVVNEYVDGVGALYYGDTITEVPQNLFRNKDTLASVSIPETVTTIKSGAFYDCDMLASYDFPDTLTTIEADAFRSCNSLAIFDFPSVETIGNYAFRECPFETVILSDTLRTTGTGVFFSCTKLKTIQIGSGLTSISDSLCYGCTILEAIDIPITIKRIEQNAFYNCTAIETLYLHGGIEYIGAQSFYGNKIKSVTLGERTSALERGTDPFYSSTAYMTDAYITDIKSWFLWQPRLFTYNNVVRNLYVNGELLTEVVTPSDYDIVSDYAFYKNPHITRVTVTDNVTSVGGCAFNGLSNANYLYLGSGASYYNDDNNTDFSTNEESFTDFDGTLVLNNTNGGLLKDNYFTKVIFMSDTTVSSSRSTQEVEFIGDVLSVKRFPKGVYDNGFENVTKVVINCNQLHIGFNLFQGSSLLTEFDFSKVVSIGGDGFNGTSITELTNAPLLTSISDRAFEGTKLKTVDLSNSPLTSIWNDAFKNCTELTEVILPSTSYNIKDYVFRGCSKLKHIKMVAEDIETEIMEMETARITGVYDTGIFATVDSRLEFDYKYTQSPSGDGYYEVIGAGNTDDDNVFQIRIQNGVFHFHIGSSQFGVSNITPNVFHHFVVSLDDGVIVDGVQKGTFSRSNYTINAPFYINGIQYAPNRNANGEFGTIKIDDVVITPKEDGFYNGAIKLNVVKSGEYEYYNEVIVKNEPAVPTINNYTFYGIAQYGFLETPLELNYASWLSTNSYYLGYYKWNRFKLSATELDFDASDTYDVTVENGIPSNWEISHLPFWLTASVMSGGEGTTTITFTRIADYVENDDIIIYCGTNYVIKAKYGLRVLNLTNVDSYTINLDTEGFTASGLSDWVTVVSENGTTTFTGDVIYEDLSTDVRFTNGEESYVIRCVKYGSKTPLPKADNRIYYTGSITPTAQIRYGTNAELVGYGTEGRVNYVEYDRPITQIVGVFMKGMSVKRVSLPSTLLYIYDPNIMNPDNIYGSEAFHTDTLEGVDFGGNELFIGNYAFYSKKLRNLELPSSVRTIGYCCFNGRTTTLNIGPNCTRIAGGAFANMDIDTINFYGANPPQFINANTGGQGAFIGISSVCEVHAPIGSDYSVLYSDGDLPSTCPIIYDLEAVQPTSYETSRFLDGGHIRINPTLSAIVFFYNSVENKYSLYNIGGANNYTADVVEKTYTVDGVSTTVEIRGEQGDIIVEQYATLNSFYVTPVNNVVLSKSWTVQRYDTEEWKYTDGFSLDYTSTTEDGVDMYTLHRDGGYYGTFKKKFDYNFSFSDLKYGVRRGKTFKMD
jgi:hypothetical protein